MSKLIQSLATLFNVRQGEGKPLMLLIAHSFFSGLGIVFFEISTNTLFLSLNQTYPMFSAQLVLPYVYIVTAMITIGLGTIYSKLESRLNPANLLKITLSFLLGMLVVFYIGAYALIDNVNYGLWFAVALMIWKGVHWTLLMLEFWALAGLLFNVRQGKRLFGLAAGGEIAAGIIGGLSVTVLVNNNIVRPMDLVLISAVCLTIGLWLLERIIVSFPDKFHNYNDNPNDPHAQQDDNGNGTDRRPFNALFKDRYLRLFFLVSAISSISWYLIDFSFYNGLEQHYPDHAQLASFFGYFFAVLSIVKFFGSTLVSGPLLTRYGLSVGLLTLPATILLGVIAAIVANDMFSHPLAFMWVIVLTKLLDEMLRTALENPTFRILYQPLEASERLRIQSVRESIIEPVAGGMGSIGLLLLTSGLMLSAIHISYIMVIALGSWFVVAVLLRYEYTKVLTNALNKRKLDGLSLALEDGSSIPVLQKGLESPIPGEVIYCLNTLEEIQHNALGTFLIKLLGHPEPQVREHVLRRIEQLNVASATSHVLDLVENETSSHVRGIALRTLCRLADAESFEQVVPYIDDSDSDVKRGAIVGLLRSGGIDGVLAAGETLNALLHSEKTSERQFAAEVLGEVGTPSFYRPLLKLLRDPEREVRIAALNASAKLGNLKLLPLVMDNLSESYVREFATATLESFGEPALPTLKAAFAEEDKSVEFRVRIVRICGHIGGSDAINMLQENLEYPIQEIRHQILTSLVFCRYRASGAEEITRLERMISDGVKHATWLLAVLHDLHEDPSLDLLTRALQHELQKSIERIFSLLSFIYSASSMLQAQKNLHSKSTESRAHALEVLDNVISQELKTLIFPLLDNISENQRLARLTSLFPQQSLSRNERIKEIIQLPQRTLAAWSKASALFLVGQSPLPEFYPIISNALSSPDALIRETAVWALAQLNPPDLAERLQPLKHDLALPVSRFVNHILDSVALSKLSAIPSSLRRHSGHYRPDFFANILLDPQQSREHRSHAAQVLATLKGDVPQTALTQALQIDDEHIRSAVLNSLLAADFELNHKAKSRLQQLVNMEIDNVQNILRCLACFPSEGTYHNLVTALGMEVRYHRARLLAMLCLLATQARLHFNLHYWYIRQQQAPANALQQQLKALLLHIEDSDQRKILRMLFQNLDTDSLLVNWLPHHTIDQRAQELHLSALAFGSSAWLRAWTRACALDTIVRLRLTSYSADIVKHINDVDDIVSETAIWALHQLAPALYREHSIQLRDSENPMVANIIRRLEKRFAT